MLQHIFREKHVMQLRGSTTYCAGTIKGYWPSAGIIILLWNKMEVAKHLINECYWDTNKPFESFHMPLFAEERENEAHRVLH